MVIQRFSKWRPSAILDFENLQFLSCGLCRHAVLLPGAKFRWYRTIGWWVMVKKRFSRWRPSSSRISKISIFGHVTVIGFNIWCYVPNFIEIGRFFTEIWRYNNFQNGGRSPSWISKICSFFHVAFVGMRFCVHTKFRRNRTIGRWVTAKKSDFQDGRRRHLEF